MKTLTDKKLGERVGVLIGILLIGILAAGVVITFTVDRTVGILICMVSPVTVIILGRVFK